MCSFLENSFWNFQGNFRFKGTTLREEIFARRNFRGRYFREKKFSRICPFFAKISSAKFFKSLRFAKISSAKWIKNFHSRKFLPQKKFFPKKKEPFFVGTLFFKRFFKNSLRFFTILLGTMKINRYSLILLSLKNSRKSFIRENFFREISLMPLIRENFFREIRNFRDLHSRKYLPRKFLLAKISSLKVNFTVGW